MCPHPLNYFTHPSYPCVHSPPVGVNGSRGNGDRNVPPANSARSSPLYTVAIIAVQHDLVPYAETIEKRVSTEFYQMMQSQGHKASDPIRTHIIVLLSGDHLTPCLADLTRDGVPFAFICTATNWSHGSCTLRILHIPTQQGELLLSHSVTPLRARFLQSPTLRFNGNRPKVY